MLEFVLSMRVEGVVKLFWRPFVVTDAVAHVILLFEMEHRRLRTEQGWRPVLLFQISGNRKGQRGTVMDVCCWASGRFFFFFGKPFQAG